MMLTGSAPLGVEVQKYVQTVFECRVRQGYGLTETCADPNSHPNPHPNPDPHPDH